MPYIRPDPNFKREEDRATPGGVSLSSGDSQSATGASDNSAADRGTKSSNSGSGFQNLDNYLSANDAKGFGANVSGRVQGEINQGRQTIDQVAGEIKGQIAGSGIIPTQEQITGAVSNPVSANKDEYKGWLNQSYRGPNSLQDNSAAAGQIQGAVGNAQTKAKQTGTEAGRFALLDSYFGGGKPGYGFGEKSLDNLLVQRGGGLANPTGFKNQAAALGAHAKDQAAQVSSQAEARAGEIDRSRGAARSAIGIGEDGQVSGGALGGFQDEMNQRLVNSNALKNSQYSDLMGDLADNEWSNQTMQDLGMSEGDSLYGLKAKDFITQAGGSTLQNLATDQDYTKYQALSQLAGIDPTFLTEGTRGQAGSATNQAINYDPAQFKNAIGAKKAAYLSASKPITDEVSQSERSLKAYKSNLSALDRKYSNPDASILRRSTVDPQHAEAFAKEMNRLKSVDEVAIKKQIGAERTRLERLNSGLDKVRNDHGVNDKVRKAKSAPAQKIDRDSPR